jgi:PAS domain S-box-containing protein
MSSSDPGAAAAAAASAAVAVAALSLDDLPDAVAVVGPDGVVCQVNAAWRALEPGHLFDGSGVGTDALALCAAADAADATDATDATDAAEGADTGDAQALADGIRAVWHGRRTAFTHHYAAGKGAGRRSFRLRAVRRSSAPRQLLLVIGETTDLWPAAAHHEGPADSYPCSFRQSPIPMWVYDTDSLQFLDVNAAVVALYGWSRDEFLGMTLADIRTPADLPQVRRSLRSLGAGKGTTGPWRHLTRSGASRVVEIQSQPVHWPARRARMVTVHDITERKEAEAQRHQAQRIESLGQLTGGVAHDFNNLLTVILGNAEVLGQLLPAGSREARVASLIQSAAERGAELTQSLLAFARRQPLTPQRVVLLDLLAQIEPLLHRSLGEHIVIRLACEAGLCEALVDPGQLENALLNLALNARDAMPGGGDLLVQAANTTLDAAFCASHPDLSPGAYVRLSVSDSGSGIAPQDLPRIFEPFFTTKSPGKGTGLGLAMVYGFVKQSHGHVDVVSAPGEGTTIRMYLPCVSDAEVAEVVPRAIEGQREATRGRDELVLLVEDETAVRDFVATLLPEMGYRVITAANGIQALAMLRERPDIDLLFTDVVMPGGMSGRDLAREAAQLRSDLPVLFTSGYSGEELSHDGRLDAGVHLLSKPYHRAQLAIKLREVLDQA